MRFIVTLFLFSFVQLVYGQIYKIDSLYNKLKVSDNFGSQILFDGDEIFISETGLNTENEGSVFVYKYLDGLISKVQTIDNSSSSQLGRRICKSDNHLLLSHTMNGGGPLLIYSKEDSDKWMPKQSIWLTDVPNNFQPLAFDMAISGETFIISCQNWEYYYGIDFFSRSGDVYVFEFNDSDSAVYKQELSSQLKHNGMDFGYSVDIDSNLIVVGAPGYYEIKANDTSFYTGAAFIYKRDEQGSWNEMGEVLAFDRDENNYFGYDVCIDFPYIIIGAYKNSTDKDGLNYIGNSGSSYLYKFENNTVKFIQKITSLDRSQEGFGITNSICDSMIIIGSTNGPSVFKIVNDSAVFIKSFESKQNRFAFTYSVAMGKDLFGYIINPITQLAKNKYSRVSSVLIHSFEKDKLSSIEKDKLSSIITSLIAPKIDIYPNPTTGIVYMGLENNTRYSVIISNVSGRIIYEKDIQGEKMIDCSFLNQGLYFLTIKNIDGIATRKFIKN